jgi:hypothetical protein
MRMESIEVGKKGRGVYIVVVGNFHWTKKCD